MVKILEINGLGDICFKDKYKLDQNVLSNISKQSELLDILNIQPVPDVYRYDLFFDSKDTHWYIQDFENLLSSGYHGSKFKDMIPNKENLGGKDVKVIVLVLESPHVDEFKYFDKKSKCIDPEKKFSEISKIKPIAPAQGTTGNNIWDYFDVLFDDIESKLDKKYKYKIVISNPIPYQTSLFSLHGKPIRSKEYHTSFVTLRDRVWKKMWEMEEIREDFQSRIEGYDPSIIVNACTAGISKYITDFCKSNFGINPVKIDHPSNWQKLSTNKKK